MQALGINPSGPISSEQADKIKALVWSSRKARERQLRDAAKGPRPLNPLPVIDIHEGSESPPEDVLFWAMSQRSLLIGVFSQQYKIGPYSVDFGFPDIKLAVEVDGKAYHSSPADLERDRRRTAYLAKCGWTVIRFRASDVFANSMTIADKIARTVSGLQAQKGLKEAWE